MTGYGRGEATNGTVTVVVELKSVNNRFLDVQVRVPRAYSLIEPRFGKTLKGQLSRGRIDVFVRRQATESGHSIVPDPQLAERYLKAATEVAKRLARPDETVPTSWILAQPGVLNTVEQEADAIGEWDGDDCGALPIEWFPGPQVRGPSLLAPSVLAPSTPPAQ